MCSYTKSLSCTFFYKIFIGNWIRIQRYCGSGSVFQIGIWIRVDTAKNRRKKQTGKTHYLYTELNFIKKIPVHFQRKIVFLSRFHIFCKINTGNVSVKKRSDPDPDPNKYVNTV